MLRGLNTLDEQLYPVSGVDKLHADARKLAPRVRSLKGYLAVHPAVLVSARRNIILLDWTVQVVQRQFSDVQMA